MDGWAIEFIGKVATTKLNNMGVGCCGRHEPHWTSQSGTHKTTITESATMVLLPSFSYQVKGPFAVLLILM